MSIVQTTLDGGETDEGRTRPDTFRWCEHCEEYVLRSQWPTHEDHHLRAAGEFYARSDADGGDNDGEDDGEETVEKVGAWYEIELHYTVEYRFKVPAWNEHQAQELAEDWVLDAAPADKRLVHTRKSTGETIWEDDDALPEDFDMYGGERIYDAIQRAKDDDGEVDE